MDNVRDEVGKLIDVIVRAMFEGESMKCLKKAIAAADAKRRRKELAEH